MEGQDYDFCLFQGPLSGNHGQCNKPPEKHIYPSSYGDPITVAADITEGVAKTISFPTGKK